MGLFTFLKSKFEQRQETKRIKQENKTKRAEYKYASHLGAYAAGFDPTADVSGAVANGIGSLGNAAANIFGGQAPNGMVQSPGMVTASSSFNPFYVVIGLIVAYFLSQKK